MSNRMGVTLSADQQRLSGRDAGCDAGHPGSGAADREREAVLSVSNWRSSIPVDVPIEAGVACRDGFWRIYLRANGDGIFSKLEFPSRTKALKYLIEVMASG